MAGIKGQRKRKLRRKQLFEQCGYAPTCHYCKIALNDIKRDPLEATVDHIIPSSYGGSDDLDNLVLSCKKCNHIKDNKILNKPALTFKLNIPLDLTNE